MQRAAVLPVAADEHDEHDAREQALVERARRGDTTAWSQLYHEHFQRVFKHVAYLSGGTHAAEDLAQETFARAFVSLPQYAATGSFVGWLRGIAVNVVRRHWRSRYRGEQAMDRLATMTRDAAGADLEHDHLRQRRAEALLAALETLPEPLRERSCCATCRRCRRSRSRRSSECRPATCGSGRPARARGSARS